MAKRKYTRIGEKSVAYQCTYKKCNWQGTEEEKVRHQEDEFFTVLKCPKCGNSEFYGLLELPKTTNLLDIEKIKINGKLVFELKSKNHWINSFPGAIAELPRSEQYLWVDKNGNTATCGEDFMFAEQSDSYPIKIYLLQRVCHLDPKNENYVKQINNLF